MGSRTLRVAVAAAALLPATPAAAHTLPSTGSTWLIGPQPVLAPLTIGGSPAGVRPGMEQTGTVTPKDYGNCGPGALPETGLQGQVPRADQDSGRSKEGYRCNLRLVGGNDIQARGANFQLAFYGDCAYAGIVGNQLFQSPSSDPPHPLEGVAVLDVADPAQPKVVTILQSPMGRSQHEAIEVNEKRGMLAVAIGGIQGQWLELYDVRDCRKPAFKGRYDAQRPFIHGLRISDDGNTIYLSDNFGISGSVAGEVVHVLDVADMSAPRLLTTWDPTDEGELSYGVHDFEVSDDGRRLYVGVQPYSSDLGNLFGGPPSNYSGPSMVVLDSTGIQTRQPDAQLRTISQIQLPNFGHTIQRARIGGRPYLLSSGETVGARAENCPWAWGHVLDMSDETSPRPVSEIKLEVNDAANCEQMQDDDAVYSIHYVGVDDEKDTKRVFYTYYTGGLRVFDVRDPAAPREIAYYHPPPMPETVFQPTAFQLADKQTPTWDSATSVVHYRPRTGRLWFVSIGRGFQVIELTGDARPAQPAPSPPCRDRRRVAIRVPLRRGERIRRLRVQVDGRRTKARRRGRRTVVVKLGAPGRRVRLVVRTTRGRRVVVRRAYRPLCA